MNKKKYIPWLIALPLFSGDLLASQRGMRPLRSEGPRVNFHEKSASNYSSTGDWKDLLPHTPREIATLALAGAQTCFIIMYPRIAVVVILLRSGYTVYQNCDSEHLREFYSHTTRLDMSSLDARASLTIDNKAVPMKVFVGTDKRGTKAKVKGNKLCYVAEEASCDWQDNCGLSRSMEMNLPPVTLAPVGPFVLNAQLGERTNLNNGDLRVALNLSFQGKYKFMKFIKVSGEFRSMTFEESNSQGM